MVTRSYSSEPKRSDAEVKRKPGRPKGSRNKPRLTPAVSSSATLPKETTRATLEADRDRLLAGIEGLKAQPEIDWRTIAQLQSQLNGVNRMLLRITGETAPTDANLIRSPQYARMKADLIAALKPYPEALAAVARVFDTAE